MSKHIKLKQTEILMNLRSKEDVTYLCTNDDTMTTVRDQGLNWDFRIIPSSDLDIQLDNNNNDDAGCTTHGKA